MNRPANLVGLHARAWRLTADREAYGKDFDEAWTANISSWLLHGVGFHPFWEWWLVGVVHLREIPGTPPTHKQYPEAEYEFGIHSLDAKGPEGIQVGNKHPFAGKVLTPPDVIKHFDFGTSKPVEERDRLAAQICEKAILGILDGHFSPDSDFRRIWMDAIDSTVEHFLTGGHIANFDTQHRKGAVN